MQTLKDVAQQARFAAMQPRQISTQLQQQHKDIAAFERAAALAADVRYWRSNKARAGAVVSPGRFEAIAREAERKVREIAVQSEIVLQRRHDAAEADKSMLGIMLGASA